MTMARLSKVKPTSVKADPRLWSVVRFQGAELGTVGLRVDGRTLLGLYATKAEADTAAAGIKGSSVLPPALRGPAQGRSEPQSQTKPAVGGQPVTSDLIAQVRLNLESVYIAARSALNASRLSWGDREPKR
jgi:hypothetical protein